MTEKGNRIENWNESYEDFGTTYSEAIDTAANLANTVQFEFVREDIERFLPAGPRPRVLECGCGGARTSLYLARRGYDVTCSDNAPEAIRLAKDNFAAFGAAGTFLEDDLLDSRIPEESFDCVMSFGLLEHFRELGPVLASLTRLVRPGGIQIHCVITKKFSTQTLADLALYPARFAVNLGRGRFRRIFTASYRDFPHYENSFPAREYCRAFEKEGNAVLRCEAGGFLFPFLSMPVVGTLAMRWFPERLRRLTRIMDRTQSGLGHFLAPTFYVVCRKRDRGASSPAGPSGP